MRKFADTPKGWYQEQACGILASLSLVVDAHDRMNIRGGSLQWLYRHEMEYHFKRAIFDTLRLLQILTHDTDIVKLIQKHTSFEELDRFMLNELIERITIYETPGMGRYRKGKEKIITIYYKFVGTLQ